MATLPILDTNTVNLIREVIPHDRWGVIQMLLVLAVAVTIACVITTKAELLLQRLTQPRLLACAHRIGDGFVQLWPWLCRRGRQTWRYFINDMSPASRWQVYVAAEAMWALLILLLFSIFVLLAVATYPNSPQYGKVWPLVQMALTVMAMIIPVGVFKEAHRKRLFLQCRGSWTQALVRKLGSSPKRPRAQARSRSSSRSRVRSTTKSKP
jgi:hypothetical protein